MTVLFAVRSGDAVLSGGRRCALGPSDDGDDDDDDDDNNPDDDT